MFFEISKLLNLILTSPISWAVLLLIVGYWGKSGKRRRWCFVGSMLLLVVFTNKPLVEYARHQTVEEYSLVSIDTTQHYKVAIVMGGFGAMNETTRQIRYEQNRASRLWEAVKLWRQGIVEHILITGDLTSAIQSSGGSTATLFLQHMEEMGVPRDVFLLEQRARNTRENALYTTELLNKQEVPDSKCILITSATHMERSLKCFAKVGMQLDYLSVDAYNKPEKIEYRAFYPNWQAAIDWQELMNEKCGILAYCLMGYI